MRVAAITTLKPIWTVRPQHLVLADNEIHIWRASLRQTATVRRRLWSHLTGEEQTRSRGFHRREDQSRFVVARGFLRAILAHYVGRPPCHLAFRQGDRGKPALSNPADSGMCFNVSHSRDLALYAIARNEDVGVDLEWIQSEVPWAAVAERFFSATELNRLRVLPPEARRKMFFQYWTCQEAYGKASGQGLEVPFVELTGWAPADLAPAKPLANDHPPDATGLNLWSFAAAAGYVASVAAKGRAWRFKFWQYP